MTAKRVFIPWPARPMWYSGLHWNRNRSTRPRHPMQHVMASSPSSGNALQEFAALVGPSREDESIPLAAAALAMARMEYPELDADHYLARLDEMAEQVRIGLRKN